MPYICANTGPLVVGGTSVTINGEQAIGCAQWVDATDDAASLITSADIAATAGGVAGGMVALFLVSFVIGSFMRLIHNSITGD